MAKAISYEVQSKWSVRLSAGGAVVLLAAVFLVFSRFNFTEFSLQMRAGSGRYFAVLLAVLIGAALGAIAAMLGFVAADQKRNTNSSQAWIGFALGATVATLSVCLGVVFWLTKDIVQ